MQRNVSADAIDRAMTVAVQLHHERQYSAAERIYRQVLALKLEHIDAMIEFLTRRYDAAIALLLRVLAGNDSNAGYSMNLGAVYGAAEHMDLARACYARGIELAPTYADPYYNLGDIQLRERQPEAAIATFDAC